MSESTSGFFSGGSAGSLGALAAGVAIPAARFGIPLAAAAPAAGVALGVASAVLAGAAAAYYLRQYLNQPPPSWVPFPFLNSADGWVSACGSTEMTQGSIPNGSFQNCPGTSTGICVAPPNWSTSPVYRGLIQVWEWGTYNCADGDPYTMPAGTWFRMQGASAYQNFSHPDPSWAASLPVLTGVMPLSQYGQWNPPIVIDAESAIDALATPGVIESIPWTPSGVPSRDALMASIPATTEATKRGYDVPEVLPSEVVGYRTDAYARNPGLTFAWEYAPPRNRGVDVPPVVAPPLVRPVPGIQAPAVPAHPTATQTTSYPAAQTSVPAVVVDGVVVAPIEPWRPFPAPPEKGVKERKVKMSITGQAAGLPGGSNALRLFNMATEFCDAVDALWDAIPFKTKLQRGFVKRTPKSARFAQERKPMKGVDVFGKDGGRNWSKPGCLKKASQVNEAWKDIHLPTAVKNLIVNELTDRGIGTLAQKATKAHARAQRSVPGRGSHSPLLGPTL